MVLKSRVAFLMTCENLFRDYPEVYFWTFTFNEATNTEWASATWSRFWRELSDMYGGYIAGVRVAELHEDHGLHFHLLVNQRMAIAVIRRMALRYGFFWLDVRKCDWGAAYYLMKYLDPSRYPLPHCRRWQALGTVQKVRKNNIVIDCPYNRARRRVVGADRVPIGFEGLLRLVYNRHGVRGLRLCWGYMGQRRYTEACSLGGPLVELTRRGGLRLRRHVLRRVAVREDGRIVEVGDIPAGGWVSHCEGVPMENIPF